MLAVLVWMFDTFLVLPFVPKDRGQVFSAADVDDLLAMNSWSITEGGIESMKDYHLVRRTFYYCMFILCIRTA